MKAINTAEPTTDQPNLADEVLRSPAVQQKFAEIRDHLPGLLRLNEAFAGLHELLDEENLAGNFETACEQKFGVNPELLIEATERLSSAAGNHLEKNDLN